MKKITLILFFILFISKLFCVSQFACIFTLLNPSATDVCFGNDSGAANIWNTSPLSVWSNPAKLGYHKGFTFGYSHDPWFEDVPGINDMYLRSSYASFGWNGIGILLPALCSNGKYGTFIDYGKQEMYDAGGNYIGSFSAYESDTKFAIGINTLEVISSLIKNRQLTSLQNCVELSLGYNYDIIYSKLGGQGQSGSSTKKQGKSFSTGIGGIFRLSLSKFFEDFDNLFILDLASGVYLLNPSKTEIKYTGETQKDSLPWGTRSAFSGKLSVPLSTITIPEYDIIQLFCENIFSVQFSFDKSKLETNERKTNGYGFEYTFFDILSIRHGSYENKDGCLIGDTFGIGLNFYYKKTVLIQYNFTKFPGGGMQETQNKWDILFRTDFVALYKMLNL